MSAVYFFRFNGMDYVEGDDAEFQRLLEDISDAVQYHAWNDPELVTDAEREEAVSQSWDGTSRDMGQWANMIGFMQMCPYDIQIERVEVTVDKAVREYVGVWFEELKDNEDAIKLAGDMIRWAVPESDPMYRETILELTGMGNDGAEILDSVDLILRARG